MQSNYLSNSFSKVKRCRFRFRSSGKLSGSQFLPLAFQYIISCQHTNPSAKNPICSVSHSSNQMFRYSIVALRPGETATSRCFSKTRPMACQSKLQPLLGSTFSDSSQGPQYIAHTLGSSNSVSTVSRGHAPFRRYPVFQENLKVWRLEIREIMVFDAAERDDQVFVLKIFLIGVPHGGPIRFFPDLGTFPAVSASRLVGTLYSLKMRVE